MSLITNINSVLTHLLPLIIFPLIFPPKIPKNKLFSKVTGNLQLLTTVISHKKYPTYVIDVADYEYQLRFNPPPAAHHISPNISPQKYLKINFFPKSQAICN